MAISNRVQQNQFTDQCEVVSAGVDTYIIDRCGKFFGIWELIEGYTQTSGQTMNKGKRVIRYDLDAGPLEGTRAKFATVAEAEEYIHKWLTRSKRLVR